MQGTHWGALGNHVRGAESKTSWGEWGCEAAAGPRGTLKLGGCQFRASGKQRPRQNGRRVYGEMSVKDKGEREKRGPEASGLTPVERGREGREGCKPFSLLRDSQKGSQGLVGSPRAKTAHWRSPAWAPQWPSSCSSPAWPPPSVLSDWLGAAWEGMALVCIVQKIPELWKLSDPLLMAGSLEGGSERHTQGQCREVPPGPGEGTRQG